jgi:SAM-dependent methyltransferase
MSAKQQATLQAGGVDWPTHWRQKAEASQVAGARTEPRDESDAWGTRAGRFANMAQALDPKTDPLALAIREAVRPTDHVLDVGAGAGRYTFAVAPLVEHVTAVEPSAGMRAALLEGISTRGVSNVSVVPSAWQQAEVEPHDVALVSSVLYFVVDGAAFLEKLDQCATRACYIFHRVEERGSVLGPLWREMNAGKPAEPGFLDLYNLLFAVGIHPSARIIATASAGRFATIEDALADARQFLGLEADDHSADLRVQAFLEGWLLKDERGFHYPHGPEMAVVWWEKHNP